MIRPHYTGAHPSTSAEKALGFSKPQDAINIFLACSDAVHTHVYPKIHTWNIYFIIYGFVHIFYIYHIFWRGSETYENVSQQQRGQDGIAHGGNRLRIELRTAFAFIVPQAVY